MSERACGDRKFLASARNPWCRNGAVDRVEYEALREREELNGPESGRSIHPGMQTKRRVRVSACNPWPESQSARVNRWCSSNREIGGVDGWMDA